MFHSSSAKGDFPPMSMHTGLVKTILPKSALAVLTLPPVNGFNVHEYSIVRQLLHLSCFLVSLSVYTYKLCKQKQETSKSVKISGKAPTCTKYLPHHSVSPAQSEVDFCSNSNKTLYRSILKIILFHSDTILEKTGLHMRFPSLSLETISGLTSNSWPTFNTPFRILLSATLP